MEKLIEIYKSSVPFEAKRGLLDKSLNEKIVKLLTNDELKILIASSLNYFALETLENEEIKTLVSYTINLLHLHRSTDVNIIISNITKEILSDEAMEIDEALDITKRFFSIETVEKLASPQILQNLLMILKRIQAQPSLSALVFVAAIINDDENCLPPQQSQQVCIEIINLVSQFQTPANQKIEFMQAISEISSAVKKIWLSSSRAPAVLSSLAHIYAIMAVGNQKSPSPSLASFLDVAPDAHIDIALYKLLEIKELSEDIHVKTVAITLCDWMIQWPKALRVSEWVVRLFRLLTLENRSDVVADVISEKGSMLMERSIVPIIRHSTAPVLPYILLTIRDQPLQKIEKLLLSAIRLFTFLKHQSSTDPSAAELREELSDAFHVLSEKIPPTGGNTQASLRTALKDFPKPSEQVVLRKITIVPSLFNSHPSRDGNGPVVLDNNWLSERTSTGKIGLINLGNTCYANAVVQALLMNHDFTRAVLAINPSNGQLILAKLQQVLGFLLCSFRAAYSPAVFIKTSRPPWFDVGRQQDCSEFLRYLMDSLYEQESAMRSVAKCNQRWTVTTAKGKENQQDGTPEVAQSENCQEGKRTETAEKASSGTRHSNETGNRSLVHQVFGGKMTTIYRCLACGMESHHQDFFTDLHLAFPKHDQTLLISSTPTKEELTVDHLLRNYLLPEKLSGDNRYQCDQCEKLVEEAERILQVDEAPKHLLLTLMRFCYDRENQRRGKITSKVKYSQRVELPLSDGSTCAYVLYAVVVHSGITLDAGHYYTLARSSDLCPEDAIDQDKSNVPWYLFNDSQVSRTDFDTLISLSNKYPYDTPYLLWYRKIERAGNSYSSGASDFPPLPQELKRLIDDDNAQFIRERLQYTSRPPKVTWKSPPNDDDDQGDFQGDILRDNPGSRFVF